MGQEKYENEDNINIFLDGGKFETPNPDREKSGIGGKPGYLITPDTSDDPKAGPQPEFIETHYKGINEISKDIWKTWTSGKPLSQENKRKRIQLQKEKEQLYADVDLLETGFANLTQIMDSGKYSKDALAGNIGDSRFLAAVSAMHNPTGKAENGDYVKPGRDKNGNLILNLFGKNGKPVLTNMQDTQSAQMSYRASDISSIITPEFPQLRKSGTKLFDNLIKSIAGFNPNSKSYGGNVEIEGNRFKNTLNDLVESPEALQYAMYEKRFSHFQSSFVDDLMGNKGKGSNLSATLFQAISDTQGVDANGNVILPKDADGNTINIDTSGGTNPDGFDLGDFANEGVGLQNYTTMASAIQNRNNPYYNEDTTRGVFLHWAQQKGMEQALVVRGQMSQQPNWFKNDFRKEQNQSAATAQSILQAVKAGDFDNLILPKKTDGGEVGIIKWNPTKKKYQVERGNEVSTTFEPTNRNIEVLMRQNGVSGLHINQMKKLGYFNQPMWIGPSQGMRNLYPYITAPPRARTTKLEEEKIDLADELLKKYQ